MYSKIKLFGHPLHPMLVGFPITLYALTLVGYLGFALTHATFWLQLGIFANMAGVGMALLTAVPGFLDWLIGIPGAHPAKRVGVVHMGLNVTALALFAVNAWLHAGYWGTSQTPDLTPGIVLAVLGNGITLAAGWFGYELIQKHHVSVELSPTQEQAEPTRLHRAA